MASLKDATQFTDTLESLIGDLRSELENGNVDFERLVSLSDEISESADGLAETFSNINQTLMERIDQVKNGSSKKSGGRSQRSKAGAAS